MRSMSHHHHHLSRLVGLQGPMVRPVLPLPALVLIVVYFVGLYRLIHLSPYIGLDWADYWEPWRSGRPEVRRPPPVACYLLASSHCPFSSSSQPAFPWGLQLKEVLAQRYQECYPCVQPDHPSILPVNPDRVGLDLRSCRWISSAQQ